MLGNPFSQEVERTFFMPKVYVFYQHWKMDDGQRIWLALSTLTFEEDEPWGCCFFGAMFDESALYCTEVTLVGRFGLGLGIAPRADSISVALPIYVNTVRNCSWHFSSPFYYRDDNLFVSG